MNHMDDYVARVLSRIPPCLPERTRIEADLRSHLADRIEAGESEAEAVARMGPPDEVAREFLAHLRLRPATIWRRIGAFLIDVALGLVVSLPLVAATVSLLAGRPALPSPIFGLLFWAMAGVGLAVFLLSIVYYPVLEARYGQTLGKRVLGLCVVKENGERIDWKAAIIRRIPWYVELFWLDAIFAPFTENHQRAFDLVARTIVVDTAG